MASARPSGPERPNKMEYKETPAKIAIADAGASNSDPTRRSTAVLPSHSVARTNPGDAIFPPENPGIIRGALLQIKSAIKPVAKLWRLASITKNGPKPLSIVIPSTTSITPPNLAQRQALATSATDGP